MDSTTLVLAGLVLVNVVVLLVAVVVIRRLARRAQPQPQPSEQPHLTLDDQKKLEELATAAIERTITEAAAQFKADLAATSQDLSKLVTRLTTDVVERELGEYHQSLAAARTQALDSLSKMQQAMLERSQSLQADLDAEVDKRRQYLLERLDKKLGEAAVAYLVECLGQGADLGAQRSFLLDSLERHKDELKKEFSG